MKEKSWLYMYRIEKSLSQKELSDVTGIDRSCISMFETGTRLPIPKDAMKIARALGFYWTRFYEDSINPKLME
jgi:transcriptional regulator with XRE-family HTH domain